MSKPVNLRAILTMTIDKLMIRLRIDVTKQAMSNLREVELI